MPGHLSTLKNGDEGEPEDLESSVPRPGLVLISSSGRPCFRPMLLEDGQLLIGRGDGSSAMPLDARMSRRHARVHYTGAEFHVEDLGSQNGTFLDGKPVKPMLASGQARVLRTADSLFLLCPDLRPYLRGSIKQQGGRVEGPILQAVLARIAQVASFSSTLHLTGESGSGKEGAAQAFHHASSHASGPFVPVNCAAIPQGVAERVLFGARRGAYSGAHADADGYVQTAHGGTLFLDEIAELEPAVQAKLLRVLETKEVCQLGSTRSRSVQINLCSATNKDLRSEVSAGRFREDLYFRLSRPSIELPALRRRLEEIPWLIEAELAGLPGALLASAVFVESCLLRFWPGNIREFLTEVRTAAHLALSDKKAVLEARYLSPLAGREFSAEPPAEHPLVCANGGASLSRSLLERALQRTGGNISAAARLLNMHRTQFKRNLERLGIDAASLAGGGDGDGE